MAAEKIHVVVNPNAAGKRTAKRWPHILKELTATFGPVSYSFTDAPYDGAQKVRAALKDGADLIIAVGGDGTFSECINGFFEDGALINPAAEAAFITSGTGCDIRRAFEWPEASDHIAMINLIASGESRRIDLGHITMTDHEGRPSHRYFANVASFGVGGAVSNAVNNSKIAKKFGGTLTFYFHALSQGLRYKNQRVRIQVDDILDEEFDIILAVAALCPYFGGGLKIAPDADPQDGLFDILIGHDITSAQVPKLLSQVYSGSHIHDPNIRTARGKKIIATPVREEKPVLLEVDGESPGSLKSEFTILPAALNLRG